MQNPFDRLRKYDPNVNDPSENRTTETLAACLILSEQFRRNFLQFLFNQKPPFDLVNAATCEISTQQMTTKGKRVDLLIDQEGEWAIVVEVKVRDREDGIQIKEYRDWLDETKGRKNSVFHLIKNHDRSFDITNYGGKGTRTWKELYDYLWRNRQEGPETTDTNLVKHFCGYLEAEGVVSTWRPAEILEYGKGVVARRALNNLFEQVANRLEDLKQDYQTRIVMKLEEWPRLEVGKTSWKALFGKEGYLNKVYAFYQTQAAWAGEAEGFYFEIKLWDRWHRCDWGVIHPKVPAFVKRLEREGFAVWADLTANKTMDRDIDSYNFEGPPLSIKASMETISPDQIQSLTSEALVDDLYQRVLRHCSSVSRLG